MKVAGWVCTSCGMESSRRWNVERHIKNKHGGRSEAIGKMAYVIKALDKELPFPTYPTNMRPTFLTGNNLLTVINSHIEHNFENGIYNIINTEIDGFRHSIQVKVCEDCLNIIHDCGANLQKSKHVCDPGWLLKYRSISERERRLVIKHLESKIPSLLMTIFRKKNLTHSWNLFAMEEMIELQTNKKCLMTLLRHPYIGDSEITVLSGLSNLQKKEDALAKEYIPLLPNEFGWVAKAIQDNYVAINDDELLQFLRIAKANRAKIKIRTNDGSTRYFLFLIA